MRGLGCMRLSTDPQRDDTHSAAVIAAALDAGIDLLDTADAYGLDEADVGHNERLIASVGAARRAMIVTKGGLVRPGGAWVPDGRARHLAAAARASRDRLGVDAIDLYLLHAVDPRTALATSVRALAKLRADGIARAIGLSNVTPTQLEEALAITSIDAVEVELSAWRLDAIRGGLVAACERRGIRVLAHRPLGGPAGAKRAARDPELNAIAARLGATPAEVALAWLCQLSPAIVPLPGATRVETARSAARELVLDADAIAALAARFLVVGDARRSRGRADDARGEVVMIAGIPGGGKSTLAVELAAAGYARLNRDERGGTLLELARALDGELARGAERVVVDNTYPTRASRAPVIEVARRHGLPIRCIVTATPLEQAQTNAVARMLARHGRLLEPAEIARDPGVIGPGAQFRWRRQWEPPRVDEGFDSVEERPFSRAARGSRAGLIVELDQLVWHGRPRTPDAIAVRADVAARLAAWSSHVIAGTTWQPGLDDAALAALQARLVEIVGIDIAVARCAHPAGPPVCWCRKPLPGLGLALAYAHDLDLAQSVHVGRGPADRGFAARLGMRYVDIADGWPEPSTAPPASP